MEGRGASKFNKAVVKVKGLAVLGKKKHLFPFLNWKEQDREGSTVWDAAFSNDGALIASTCGLNVKLFASKDGSLLLTLRGHKAAVRSVAVCGESKRVASGSSDNHIIVWNSESGGVPLYHWYDSGPLETMCFNGECDLASAGASSLSLWHESHERSICRQVTSPALCCAWSDDGLRLALGHEDGFVGVHDRGGREVFRHNFGNAVCSLAWNQHTDDNTQWKLFVATKDGVLHYVDIQGSSFSTVDSLCTDLGQRVSRVGLIQLDGKAAWHTIVAGPGRRVVMHAHGDSIQVCELEEEVACLKVLGTDPPMVAIGCHGGALHVYKFIGRD